MKIDKQNNDCAYNDENHKYWNVKTNDTYISVTTLIGKFKAPFDKDFWSKYKAFEKHVPQDVFKFEKGGLLNKKRWNDELLTTYGIDINEFRETCETILDEWATKSRVSCERGTKIHAEKENYFYSRPKHKFSTLGIPGEYVCKKHDYRLDIDNGIYPEYLVYSESQDGELKLAGQIDLLIKNGNDIYIIDYKTNEEIKSKSYFDSGTRKNVMMGYPLNNLMDCELMHYTLQLSTYAWMIQRINPEFNIKKLIIIHYDHNGKTHTYELDYLKKEVEAMLAYYKKQQQIEKVRDRRKKIEF